jgi:hypothetical protein
MDVVLKRTIAAGLVIIMLSCMVTVSASTAGTTADPLITLSYLDGAFASSMRSDIADTLGSAADKAMNRLDELYKTYVGYSFAPRFTSVTLAAEDTVTLSAGASFILLSGSATLTVTSGTVINISTGTEVASESRLAQYQRYFCAEDTTALITANSAATGQVDGYYLLDSTAPQQRVFIDVLEGQWYFPAVDFVYTNGLFAGTSENTFSPAMSMTRGMFVTVLYRLDGRPPTGSGGAFTDVSDASRYYYDAVTWANTNRIVTGYEDGTFRPNAAVTREQMATIMHRYATFKERDMSMPGTVYDTFPDRGDVSDYAADAMRWTVSWGVINGSDGRLLPQDTATRAQVAQIIYNYCERIGR